MKTRIDVDMALQESDILSIGQPVFENGEG